MQLAVNERKRTLAGEIRWQINAQVLRTCNVDFTLLKQVLDLSLLVRKEAFAF